MKKEGKLMNKDLLSQEEIDALLRQGSDTSSTHPSSSEGSVELNVRDYLSEFEQDTIGEIGNITFGSAATALSALLRQKVDITTPTVTVVNRDKIGDDVPLPHVAIRVIYTEGFKGANVLAIRTEDAKIIADLMLGGDGTNVAPELNELHLSAVAEAMNQMMGSASTSMSTLFSKMVNISPPTVDVIDFSGYSMSNLFPNDPVLVRVSFRLIVGDLIDSHIMQLLPLEFARELITSLTGYVSQSVGNASASTPAEPPHQTVDAPPPTGHPAMPEQPYNIQETPMYQAPPQPMHGLSQTAMPMHHVAAAYQGSVAYTHPIPPAPESMYASDPYASAGSRVFQEPKNVQPAQFSPLEMKPAVHGQQGNLDLLLDIPLTVTVELGRTKKLIREILELTPGSIIELDKLAGEPVDILINNKLIAKGEVVVIDENFGVRVTDIISPSERIRKLQ
jgi:flagellar motor switch protein FliN/FliY